MLKLEHQELELLEESCDLCGEAYKRKLDILVELNVLYVEAELFGH